MIYAGFPRVHLGISELKRPTSSVELMNSYDTLDDSIKMALLKQMKTFNELSGSTYTSEVKSIVVSIFRA